jgi:hypothetical protein
VRPLWVVLDRWSTGVGRRLCSRQPPFVAERPQYDPDLTLKSVRWSTQDGQKPQFTAVG